MSFDWGSALMAFGWLTLWVPSGAIYRMKRKRLPTTDKLVIQSWFILLVTIVLTLLGTAASDLRHTARDWNAIWFFSIFMSLLGIVAMVFVTVLHKKKAVHL